MTGSDCIWEKRAATFWAKVYLVHVFKLYVAYNVLEPYIHIQLYTTRYGWLSVFPSFSRLLPLFPPPRQYPPPPRELQVKSDPKDPSKLVDVSIILFIHYSLQ
jgi:hypothetical protein